MAAINPLTAFVGQMHSQSNIEFRAFIIIIIIIIKCIIIIIIINIIIHSGRTQHQARKKEEVLTRPPASFDRVTSKRFSLRVLDSKSNVI